MSDPKAILVVDDEQSIRELIRRILESAGYRVWSATNGEEAMKLLSEGTHVDVVVADVLMPKLGGVAMLMKLHETYPHLTAVVISGKVDLEAPSLQNLAPLLSSEKACLLGKPFEPAQLLAAVKRALERAR